MAQYHLKKGIAYIKFSNPPLNSLAWNLRDGILRSLDNSLRDKASCVVLYGDGKAFSAGADISEFAKGLHMKNPSLGEVISRLDEFEIPVVSYVNGIALGGGLETALGCHWRYGSPHASVGLPEVHLGILPGFITIIVCCICTYHAHYRCWRNSALTKTLRG
jgi:3-hydroxyacyl-CoA dehydrogenase